MKTEYKALGNFGTIGLEIVLCIIAGFYGGHWIDGKLGTAPGFTIFGFICGIGAAGKAVMRALKDMKKVAAEEERAEGNPAPRFEIPTPPEDGDRAKDDEAKDKEKEGDDGQA